MRAALLVAVMALVTMALRFLPFLVFREKTPPYVRYLGRVLPAAIIGMLVIYCLKDVAITAAPFGLPELLAAAGVVGVQCWKRNSVWSILTGTALYMLLIRLL
ncbi:MAG: AzlD domain-containing protein [Oscillospiraceae bacterium]|nr:AzlD domain-containing protein [Oscillospiraceae bacterium]MBR6207862.1 AzlD domain-containing protein [Oscillospiraceae bacterium]